MDGCTEVIKMLNYWRVHRLTPDDDVWQSPTTPTAFKIDIEMWIYTIYILIASSIQYSMDYCCFTEHRTFQSRILYLYHSYLGDFPADFSWKYGSTCKCVYADVNVKKRRRTDLTMRTKRQAHEANGTIETHLRPRRGAFSFFSISHCEPTRLLKRRERESNYSIW